jgi:hypothetical protein
VPERVLNDSSYPALLDPVISPELGVDAPVPVPRKRLSDSPAVACNATGCVVVWQESDDPYNAMATETTVCLH